jgi:riboflavin biosynthesis pyrimidine reductase
LRIPWSCKLLQDEHKTQVFTLNEPSDALSMALKENKFINAVSSGPEGLRRSLALLKRRDGVRHLMVEGGPELARSFLENKLVDRAIVISAEGVTFKDPIASDLTSGSFAAAGLECVSVYASSGDSVQCWSKVGVSWPSFPEAAELWP